MDALPRRSSPQNKATHLCLPTGCLCRARVKQGRPEHNHKQKTPEKLENNVDRKSTKRKSTKFHQKSVKNAHNVSTSHIGVMGDDVMRKKITQPPPTKHVRLTSCFCGIVTAHHDQEGISRTSFRNNRTEQNVFIPKPMNPGCVDESVKHTAVTESRKCVVLWCLLGRDARLRCRYAMQFVAWLELLRVDLCH